MGYIKKLKNNELVGGTDKHTIYPVTSAEAVFEEVSDNEFKSQKYLNNHITNERIVDNTIENDKLKDDTIDMGKLNTQLKTIIQDAYDASWKVKEEPFSLETKYDANDAVYDPDTNSSYVSLTADNQGNPVNPEDEGYVEGKWRIIINGISAVESTEVINAKVGELETEVDNKIDDAQHQLDQMIADAAASLADAESDARGAAAEASAVVANKVADAQIGYFECNTVTDTALKQTTLDYIGTGNDKSYYTIPAAGSNVRIKMKYANTAAGTIELQFGTNTATRKQLIYNGEPASLSNTWDDGEVLSIYYDPTYNNNTGAYQASNAQGGGSAMGKKELGFTESGKVLDVSGSTIGSTLITPIMKYIKLPVNTGDVVEVRGTGGVFGRLWAIAEEDGTIIDRAGESVTDHKVIVVPEGIKWVVLNSPIADSEWYHAKANSVGAHEILTEAYLYYDLRTLAVGQTYKENEAVKTTDKQLIRTVKEIVPMTVIDTISIGDFKTYGSGANASTYKALKAVNVYNGTETEGLYAIGRPSLVTITVDSSSLAIEEDTDISITIGGVTNTITVTSAASETKDADIAALIAAAFTNIEGWALTDNENGTLTLKCNTAGSNTISISSDTGETGLSITSSAVNGNSTLNQYNNGSWGDVTLATFAGNYADIGVTDNTKMWKKLSIDDLISLNTVQNTLAKTSKAESISYNNSESGLDADNVQEVLDKLVDNITINAEELFDLSRQRASLGVTMSSDQASDNYITTTRSGGMAKWTFKANSSSTYLLWITLPTLVVGNKYTISFKLDNSSGSTLNATIRDINRKQIDVIGTGYTTGSVYTVTHTFVYSSDMYIFGVAAKPISSRYISIYDISVRDKTVIKDVTTYLQEKTATLEEDLTEVINDVGEWDKKTTILGSSIPSCGASVATATGKWANKSGYYAGLVDVEEYRNKKIVLTGGNVTSSYTFTTAGVSIDNTPSYATGYGAPRSLAANTSVELTVPSNAKYLYVYLQSPGVNYRPQSIKFPVSITDFAEDISSSVEEISESISGSYLTAAMLEPGTINANTGADAADNNNNCVRTIYLPLTEDIDSVIIYNYEVLNGYGIYFKFAFYETDETDRRYVSSTGWSSSVRNAQIPVNAIGGYVRIVMSRYDVSTSQTTTNTSINEYLRYNLYLNLYGHDTLVKRVEALEAKAEDDGTSMTAQLLKCVAPNSITLCTWNIGHFSGGGSSSSSINQDNYDTQLANFRNFIYNDINPRVIALNEYSAVFGKKPNSTSHNAKDVLFNDFIMKYEGSQSNYSCNALYGNTYLTNIKQHSYACLPHEIINQQAQIYADNYYYVSADLYLEGRLVKLIVTHMAYNGYQDDQIKELVGVPGQTTGVLSNYDRAIIVGDLNINGNSQTLIDCLDGTGYSIANDGSIITYPSGTDKALDNIIYKGVVVSSMSAVTTSLSDHYPLVATITV